MFKDTNEQYINIKRYDKQLKIDTKIFKDKQLQNAEHLSFVQDDDVLSSDAVSKVNILQQNIAKTYISVVNESSNQKIVDINTFLDDNYKIIKLTSHFALAILKEDIRAQQENYQAVGLDFIFSPFALLYHHIISNGADANSINILILNNNFYAIVLDKDKAIAYSVVKSLTSFDEVHTSQFYSQEIEGQKLFDEIHFLEIQDHISTTLQEYYDNSDITDNFCNQIEIFYTIKQLNEEQVEDINQTMMIDTNYSNFPIDNIMFYLCEHNSTLKQSYIQPRQKKEKKLPIRWILAAVISTILVGYGLFYLNEQNKIKEQLAKQEQIKKAKELALKKQKEKLANIKLPNHMLKNYEVTKLLLAVFDTIPRDAMLNELNLEQKDSTFVCTLLDKNTYNKNMQPKLLKLYKSSDIVLSQESNSTYSTIISNTGLIPQPIKLKNITPKYNKRDIISTKEFVRLIDSYLKSKTKITFQSKVKSKFISSKFIVKTIMQEPQDFFDFIDKINKLKYSIVISYPIEFIKTTKGIELSFRLTLNQIQKLK